MSTRCIAALITVVTTTCLAAGPIQWKQMDEPGCGGWITSVRVSPHDAKRVLAGGDCLGAALSTDGGESWGGTFGFKSWEINDFTWHPTEEMTVWASTLSGPYISRDGGVTFSEQRSGMPAINPYRFSAPIECVLFDPNDVRHLLAVGGSNRRWDNSQEHGHVWESRDGGESWAQLARIMKPGADKGGNIVGAAFAAGSSTRLYAIVDSAGVYVSDDGGKTWTARNAGLPALSVNRLAVHPKEVDTLYISLGSYPDEAKQWRPGGIYMSSDAGRSWQPRLKGLSQHQLKGNAEMFSACYYGIAISQTDPTVLVASDSSWTGAKVYRSTDRGENWKVVCGSGSVARAMQAGMSLTFVGISPTGTDVIFGAGSEFIVRSTDGGVTWTDVTSVQPDPARPNAWRGRGYQGWCATDFAFNPRNPAQSILLGMDASKVWMSTDDLKSWTYHGMKPTPWGGGTALSWAGESIYATLGQFGEFIGLNVSHDGGRTWKLIPAGKNGLTATRKAGGVYASPASPRDVWVAAGGTLFHSTDGAETWTAEPVIAGASWLAGNPAKPQELYVRGDDGIWRITADVAPVLLGGPKPGNEGRITLDSLGRIYVCHFRGVDGGLWRMEDGKWTRLHEDPFVYAIAADPANPRRLLMGTSDHPYHDHANASGVWASEDDGKSWQQANDGLAILRISTVAFDPGTPGRVVVGTSGRGFYVGRWP